MLDTHLREMRAARRQSAELEKALVQHQRELRNQLEQMYHLLTSRLTEIERRIDPRSQRMVPHAVRGEATPWRADDRPRRWTAAGAARAGLGARPHRGLTALSGASKGAYGSGGRRQGLPRRRRCGLLCDRTAGSTRNGCQAR